jgi:hypothetical protein
MGRMPHWSRLGARTKYSAAGDVEGCAIWGRILEAAAEFTRTGLAAGERLN